MMECLSWKPGHTWSWKVKTSREMDGTLQIGPMWRSQNNHHNFMCITICNNTLWILRSSNEIVSGSSPSGHFVTFGWGTKVYVQNWSEPSSGILLHYHLTRGSTLTSQDYSPSSVCNRTNQSHLAVFSMDRNTIGCYDFVSMHVGFLLPFLQRSLRKGSWW
jgi:hypothetical protein